MMMKIHNQVVVSKYLTLQCYYQHTEDFCKQWTSAWTKTKEVARSSHKLQHAIYMTYMNTGAKMSTNTKADKNVQECGILIWRKTKLIKITSTDDKKFISFYLIPFSFWWMQTSIWSQAVGTSTPSPVKGGLQFTSASALHPMVEEKEKENKERNTMLDINS